MPGIELSCPSCDRHPDDGAESIEDRPSESWETHGLAVHCKCGETYEIRYRVDDILYWDADDEPHYVSTTADTTPDGDS